MRVLRRPLNPVLAREIKERLRTRRSTIVVTVYLAVLALILQIVYSALSSAGFDEFSGGVVATQSARLGRSLFETLLFFVLVLVCFIVPGLTADAITGERERQTLVPLQVSLLSPRAILTGKLLSSLAFVTLLVLATLPLLSVSFVLGGVSLGQMARGVAAVLATGLVVACVALACSSLTRRTQAAMVASYAAVLFLTLGTTMIYAAQAVLDDEPEPHRPRPAVLTLNPFLAAADATGKRSFDGSVTSPLELMRALLAEVDRNGGALGRGVMIEPGPFIRGPVGGFAEVTVDDDPVVVTTAPEAQEDSVGVAPGEPDVVDLPRLPDVQVGFAPVGDRAGDGVPFWLWSALSLGSVAGIAFVLGVRRLRTPSSRAA